MLYSCTHMATVGVKGLGLWLDSDSPEGVYLMTHQGALSWQWPVHQDQGETSRWTKTQCRACCVAEPSARHQRCSWTEQQYIICWKTRLNHVEEDMKKTCTVQSRRQNEAEVHLNHVLNLLSSSSCLTARWQVRIIPDDKVLVNLDKWNPNARNRYRNLNGLHNYKDGTMDQMLCEHTKHKKCRHCLHNVRSCNVKRQQPDILPVIWRCQSLITDHCRTKRLLLTWLDHITVLSHTRPGLLNHTRLTVLHRVWLVHSAAICTGIRQRMNEVDGMLGRQTTARHSNISMITWAMVSFITTASTMLA